MSLADQCNSHEKYDDLARIVYEKLLKNSMQIVKKERIGNRNGESLLAIRCCSCASHEVCSDINCYLFTGADLYNKCLRLDEASYNFGSQQRENEMELNHFGLVQARGSRERTSANAGTVGVDLDNWESDDEAIHKD